MSCQRCVSEQNREDGPPLWVFRTLPEIYYVEPESPAARAGLQIGDVLTHIDGVSLLTEDGGRRFGAVRPGQRVRWSIERGSTHKTVSVVAERRPGERVRERLHELGDLSDLGDLGELSRIDQIRYRELSREMQRLASELDQMQHTERGSGSSGRRLRYAGSVGGSDVEVRGLSNVVVDDSGDEIVITTRDAMIRIRPAAKSKDSKRR